MGVMNTAPHHASLTDGDDREEGRLISVPTTPMHGKSPWSDGESHYQGRPPSGPLPSREVCLPSLINQLPC